jgi:type 1 fimbria pilin
MALKILLTSAFLINLLPINSAWAACGMREGVHQTIRFAIPQALSIPSNASNGALIATITASAAFKIVFSCTQSDPQGIKSISGDTPVNGIMPFGETGLGYILESAGYPDLFYPQYLPNNIWTMQAPYRLKIYKVGPLKKSVSIPAGDFAYFQAGSLKIYTASLANDLVVEAGSCELATTDVTMGEYQVSEFSAVGYTSKPVDFTVGLRNCSGTINKVKYAMSPGPGWLDQANGIVKLDPGSVKGLGIQIRKDGQPVSFAVDNELPPPSGSSASYSFTAAYYQAEKQVFIGNANSSLTIQISYL